MSMLWQPDEVHRNARRDREARNLVLTVFLVASSWLAHAQTPTTVPANKGQYNLFQPTPRGLLRQMSTDRPDQTESPYTVDAGHFQLEADLVHATIDSDRSGGGELRSEDYSVAALNLKVGILNQADLQFLLDTYVQAKQVDRVAGTTERASGLGDFHTRLKINLWGNDGGRTALGVMPFVKWPLPESALRNGKTEGGILFPLAVDLSGGWGLGAMAEFDFVWDGVGGYDVEYFNTLTVGRRILGDLDGYMEFAALVTPESGGGWQGQIGLGLTYGLNENSRIDMGCNFGVTDSAPDFDPFLGFSFRF